MNARSDFATLSRGVDRTDAQHGTSAPPGSDALPRHLARDLTGGGSLARIDLDGQVYALRITRAGKLILTK